MRRHPRFESDQSVRVTCLDQPGIACLGRLKNVSAFGVGIALSECLPSGSLIKVEWGDTVLLGDLIYCRPYGDEFLAGLEVEEVFYKAALTQGWTDPDSDVAVPAASPPLDEVLFGVAELGRSD